MLLLCFFFIRFAALYSEPISFANLSCLEVELQILIGIELETRLIGCRLNRIVLDHIGAKVLLDNIVSEFVNFNIFMVLQLFDLRQAIALLDDVGNLLRTVTGHLQHVVDAIEDHINNLRIVTLQQLAERRNCARLHQLRHLILVAANRQVADGPSRLLLRLKFALCQILDDLRQESRVDHRLHLRLYARGDVRQEPDRLLPDLLLGMTQQCRKV